MLTDLDLAHQAMDARPEDDAARLRFYERLADSELFLVLASDPQGSQIEPDLFEIADQKFVLVFDRQERLAEFTGRIVPVVGLSGRSLVAMLAGQGIGIGLNLEVAPSSALLPPEAIDWLAETLAGGPEELEALPESFAAPMGLPEDLVTGLDRKLATAGGFAVAAYLCTVRYSDGAQGHLLAFEDAQDGAERALATAVREALVFSGLEAGSVDVAFLSSGEPVLQAIADVALRFDLPVAEAPKAEVITPPGMDPDTPPRLR